MIPNGLVTYALTAGNNGPSAATGVFVTDTLPAAMSFVSSTPGSPTCVEAAGVVTCALGSLAPGATVPIQIVASVNPGTLGAVVNAATISGNEGDVVPPNNHSAETTQVIQGPQAEISHGLRLSADLAGLTGNADEDRYRISQAPYSSYEVVVDEASGDVGAGAGPLLDRVAPDGSTVLQPSLAVGIGPARSLRWENSTSSVVNNQMVRVKSASCGTDCDGSDTYRIRAYETTAVVPRFNNTGSQITVLLVQNPGTAPVSGHVYFWDPAGTLLAASAFSLDARQLLVLITPGVAGVAGQSGTITLSHNGRYGELVGKTVALEPAAGFSFDSPLLVKAR